jgi:hypothetical protein
MTMEARSGRPRTTTGRTSEMPGPCRIRCAVPSYFVPSANSWLRLLMKSVLPTATGDE